MSSAIVSGTTQRFAHERLKARSAARVPQPADDVARMEGPADVIAVAVLDHHEPRVTRPRTQVRRAVDRVRDVDRDDGGAWCHHMADLLLVEVEDTGQHLRLARRKLAAGP
jgi:hypothetical protein